MHSQLLKDEEEAEEEEEEEEEEMDQTQQCTRYPTVNFIHFQLLQILNQNTKLLKIQLT